MNVNLKRLTRSAVLLAMAIVFQILKVGGQLVTGSGVNAVLLIAASTCGAGWAVMIGVLTPLFAMWLGVLKQPVFVLVPFIIAGNVIYVLLNSFVGRHNKYIGLAAAAAAKFALLYSAVTYFLKVPAPIKLAMGLPQLYTALIGGALALVILRLIPDVENK
ncbi:MAG: ECF transporter S component [Bacillota bacterium]